MKYLTRLLVSPNITANDIRQSVNITPTRARTPSGGGTGTIPSNFIRGSPVARRISTAVRKSVATTLPKTTAPTTNRVATCVVIPKRPRGRPRKNPLPAQPVPSLGTEADYTPPAAGSSKRKPSAGSQAFVPSPSALKTKTRAAKKVKTARKKVGFVDEMGNKNGEPAPATASATGVAKAAATVVANAKASKAARGAKVGKAAAAGKRVKKSSTASTGGMRYGTTRSGANFHF
jgi:hypothetical protein